MSVDVMVAADLEMRQLLVDLVEECRHQVHIAASGEEVPALYARVKPALVLLGYELPGADGLQALEGLRQQDPHCRVVMTSDHGESEVIVRAMKLGAENFLTQPIPRDELRVLLEGLGEDRAREAEERTSVEGVIGDSEAMQVVFRTLRRVARTRATVLIRGESGTGKEVIARAIHLLGQFLNASFVTVDCTNIPANLMESEMFGHERGAFTDARSRKVGLMETADGGTLFLDEIGLMPLELQAKLLNVLETQRFRRVGGNEEIEVTVRILAATNENLEVAVREGRFREDLYYRLNVVPVDLPPLRDRDEDVLLIAGHYLQWYTSLHGLPARQLAEDARALLQVYPWPGNVRELKNVIERVVLMTDSRVISASALSIDRRSSRPIAGENGGLHIDAKGLISGEFPAEGLELDKLEAQFIRIALDHTGGNITKAASLLHVSRDTLRYRIEKFQISGEGG